MSYSERLQHISRLIAEVDQSIAIGVHQRSLIMARIRQPSVPERDLDEARRVYIMLINQITKLQDRRDKLAEMLAKSAGPTDDKPRRSGV